MKSSSDLKAAKRQVSDAVLKIPGVTGVGLPDEGLTIYVESESPELRQRVMRSLEPLNLSVPIHWEVTGSFRRQ
jgi:hypothetical protein